MVRNGGRCRFQCFMALGNVARNGSIHAKINAISED